MSYKIIKKESLPKSLIKYEIEVSFEDLSSFRNKAIKSIAQDAEIPGFRKGTAPEQIIIEKYGEMSVLEEAAHHAVNDVLVKLFNDEKLSAISAPSVSVTKLAKDNPLIFTVNISVMPEFKLPDYKSIAKKIKVEDEVKVDDKEVDEYIKKYKEHHDHEHSHCEDGKCNHEKIDFESEEFKTKTKEGLLAQKQFDAKQKRRAKILEDIIKATNIETPDVLIDQELEKMLGQFQEDITRLGVPFEEYLKHIKKTQDDLKKEWREDAEKRSKLNLIVPAIAQQESISPSDEDVKQELEHVKKHVGADKIDEQRAVAYLTRVLSNEKTIEFLEKQV